MKIIALTIIVLFASMSFAQEIHLRRRPPEFPLSADMPPQVWGEGVNIQLGDIRKTVGDLSSDIKQLRRDVDRQSVIASIVTFTAQTAGVVLLTFILTTFLQVGRDRYKRRKTAST